MPNEYHGHICHKKFGCKLNFRDVIVIRLKIENEEEKMS